jgi:hypothetical protein
LAVVANALSPGGSTDQPLYCGLLANTTVVDAHTTMYHPP